MKNLRKISEYAEFLKNYLLEYQVNDDFEVESVFSDSGKCTAGTVFCAVKGVKTDGNAFVNDALSRGAGCIVSANENKYGSNNFLQVSDDRMAYSEMQRFFYGEPDRNLSLVGVTGTNGKTTSVYLFFALLRKLGRNPAIFSTVQNFDGRNYNDSQCTTPDAGVLFDFCRRALDNGADHLLLECSSHALSQSRLGNSMFKTAVFTNLTGDHLDYHQDMENYFAAKKILFYRNLAPDGTAVINIDDSYGARLAEELKNAGRNVKTFGFSNSADMHMDIIDTKFYLNGRELKTSLFGRHNFYNITGVLGALTAIGFEFDRCFRILAAENIAVPGRLEKIELGQHGTAFVDYAHTDDALQNVLAILREEAKLRNGKVICVFGCGGDRDRSKRPRMGRVASELADEFILTSDNPRSEKPDDIIKEILQGCSKAPLAIRLDRREAIKAAFEHSGANDFILVAGKGHEKEQQFRDRKIYFDDCQELRNLLRGKEL